MNESKSEYTIIQKIALAEGIIKLIGEKPNDMDLGESVRSLSVSIKNTESEKINNDFLDKKAKEYIEVLSDKFNDAVDIVEETGKNIKGKIEILKKTFSEIVNNK